MRCCLILAVSLLVGCSSSSAPAPPTFKVKPAQIATGKPNKDGVVTMLRPVVTSLHADDPFRIALHWATEKGPFPAHRDNRPFARLATLGTMTFIVTPPDRKKVELKADVKVPKGFNDWNGGLFYAPTFVLALTRDGLTQQTYPQSAQSFPWAGKQELDLGRAGVWKVSVRGTITDGKAPGIPFESEEVELEVGVPGLSAQKFVQDAATLELVKKGGGKASQKPVFLREDKAGDRVVLFRGDVGDRWSYREYAVTVKPNGAVESIKSREVFTCLARGTIIDTERGLRPIEDVRPGERVWGWSQERRQRVLTTVRAVRQAEAEQTLIFGEGLRVTAEHPLWVDGMWKPAAEVLPTDSLLDREGRSVKAGQPRIIAARVQVFDLTVDGPHCFFAGGFLVHNKDRAYSATLDDPWETLWAEPGKE